MNLRAERSRNSGKKKSFLTFFRGLSISFILAFIYSCSPCFLLSVCWPRDYYFCCCMLMGSSYEKDHVYTFVEFFFCTHPKKNSLACVWDVRGYSLSSSLQQQGTTIYNTLYMKNFNFIAHVFVLVLFTRNKSRESADVRLWLYLCLSQPLGDLDYWV